MKLRAMKMSPDGTSNVYLHQPCTART